MNAPSAPPPVSVVLPVHNESEAVGGVLREIERALTALGGEFEIIVVDDASTDSSVQAVRDCGASVRLISHDANRGYGAALKSGFAAARHGLVAFLDADGTYPPAQLPALIEAATDADMAVAQRRDYDRRASWGRRLSKTLLVPLARYLTGQPIPDINSGMRVVRREQLERYWTLLPDGFSLTTTLTMALLSAGRRVRWLPVAYAPRRGRSKVRPLRDLGNFILLILRTVTYFRPLKVYVPLSAALVAASIAVVLVSKFAAGEVMDVTALFLFIAGLQMLLIGVVADLVLKLPGRGR